MSPPRDKGKAAVMAAEGRKFSWATQRIAELEQELERSRRKYKVGLEHCLITLEKD